MRKERVGGAALLVYARSIAGEKSYKTDRSAGRTEKFRKPQGRILPSAFSAQVPSHFSPSVTACAATAPSSEGALKNCVG